MILNIFILNYSPLWGISNDKIITNEKIEDDEMEKISIKVKTIDSNEYIVNANKTSLISEVKKELEEVI